jgi:hypothetical protein
MDQPADARLKPDVARVVCVRTGGAAVLEGSIAAPAVSKSSGCTQPTARAVTSSPRAGTGVRKRCSGTLSEIARFRTRVGESLATIERYSTPLGRDDAVARRCGPTAPE